MDDKEREGEGEVGSGREGDGGLEGSSWILSCRGPRVPSYATVDVE